MLLIQMTGLSGAGKTTLAENTRVVLNERGYPVEIIDGDVYRRSLCSDLGFSRADRIENIRRLVRLGLEIARKDIIVLIAAINPYEEARMEARRQSEAVKTVWIDCQLAILQQRDPKGLYKRAGLPQGHPERISNLTGVNDPFEIPGHYDLKIDTSEEAVLTSAGKMTSFILGQTAAR